MHQPIEPSDEELKEIHEALNQFAVYCYDLLCATEFDMDGFYDGVRHIVKKYTEVIQPVLTKHDRTFH